MPDVKRPRPWAHGEDYSIKPWTFDDIPDVIELFKASGQPFFIDPRDARNKYTLLARDKDGKLVAVMTGRITSEVQLVVRPNAKSPLGMLSAIYSLWDGVKKWLWSVGIADAHAPVFREYKTFYEIARRIGFQEDDRMNLLYDIRKDMENG